MSEIFQSSGKNSTPKSTRFVFLDSLRGILSLSVVVGHSTFQFSGTTFNPNMSVAVPFFFALSGFVLHHAYEVRLAAGLAFRRFFIERLVRLLPLVVVAGFVASAYVFTYADTKLFDEQWYVILASLISTFTTLPSPFLAVDNWRWPLNHPLWSLFAEFVASFLYGAILYRTTTWILAATSAFFFFAASFLSLRNGVLSPGLTGGMALTFFSFNLGVIIRKVHSHRPNSSSLPGYGAAAMLTFVVFTPLEFSLFLTLLLLPIIISFTLRYSASVTVHGKMQDICEMLGRVSYPLYIIHWPIMLMIKQSNIFTTQFSYTMATVITCFLISLFLERYYDIPIRRYLLAKARAAQS